MHIKLFPHSDLMANPTISKLLQVKQIFSYQYLYHFIKFFSKSFNNSLLKAGYIGLRDPE